MNLVFKEYIGFLKHQGMAYDLKEGYYWLDRQIIKAYDKQGNIHKIMRIYTDDELNVSFKYYKKEDFDIESWIETANRRITNILNLEKESLALIREQINENQYHKPVILTSGGKDSSVTSYLVKRVVDNPLSIFNNTSLDCADTYLHIKKENNLKIINPKEGFYQWRERNNFIGNRTARACCTIFKEGAMVEALDKNDKYLFFMGMRNQESNTRSEYGDIWINSKWGNRDWIGVLPIRKWSEEDIWLYIVLNNIPINSKYKKGYGRVGCAVACAFYTKSTWVLDKYWYPKMYNRWHKILEEDFINNKKACILNCTLKEYHTCWNGGMLRNEPTEGVILEFAEQHGLDINIAKKYFNKVCDCGKKLKKDDVALSMKFYGRQIEKFKCINCISEDLGYTKKELKEKIEEFKEDGCALF